MDICVQHIGYLTCMHAPSVAVNIGWFETDEGGDIDGRVPCIHAIRSGLRRGLPRRPQWQCCFYLQPHCAQLSKVQQPTEALLSARSVAFATLESAVLQRPSANTLLDTYAAVLAAERPRGLLSAQDVASPAPSWNLPLPVLVSTREALKYLRRGDNLLMTVTCILASLVGVATLWQPNPAWGSLSDWLVALLTGLGVGLGGTLTLQQLTANTALPTFPR